jgi:hypothetical protein
MGALSNDPLGHLDPAATYSISSLDAVLPRRKRKPL